ncbi:hypothetical protein [Sulfitobacter aestuariivivens]|uniref:Lipoprotein n=1 Tax=Sulfitobacter aestuariivivens TaxID=2766981 RepID=A0A927D2A4_9RHOB|nr:hypothetical protein [Sulfitobacter aestuariivivens]MBD3663795.1 hypothetical protein [Sulfitobacter aestuariivivens]
MGKLFSLALCGWLVAGCAQAQRTFEGEEAAALRCANTLALTAVALRRSDLIGEEEKEVMLGVTLLILERHVSGTWAQKKKALAVVRDRRSIDATIEDYQRNAARCLEQFPIN